MRFAMDPSTLAQGLDKQDQEIRTPNTYQTQNNVASIAQNSKLDVPKQNMAGKLAPFLAEYVTNPQEQQRRDDWNNRFRMSVPGAEFNIIKDNGGQMPGGENA